MRKTESLYWRKGKPERLWQEIRRLTLEKLKLRLSQYEGYELAAAQATRRKVRESQFKIQASLQTMKTIKTHLWWIIALVLVASRFSAVAQLPPPLPSDPDQLLDTWSFANGPAWTDQHGRTPASFTNLISVPSWSFSGTALMIDTNAPAWLNYGVYDSDGNTNVTFDTGSLFFWYQPDFSSTLAGGGGPGEWANLIMIGNLTTNAADGCWCLAVDPAGTNLVFLAQTNGASQTVFSTPIDWYAGDWHFVAISYSPTNCAVYLEGELVTNAPPIEYWPSLAECTRDGMWIGSTASGQNQGHGVFQELRTFNYPYDADDLWMNYQYCVQQIQAWGGSVPSGGFQPDFGPPLPGGGPVYTPYMTNNQTPFIVTTNYLQFTNFWLTISNSPSKAYVAIQSTLSNLTYQVYTNVEPISLATWGLWTNIVATSSVTRLQPMSLRTNALFYKAALIPSTTGDELPDWWCMYYFHTLAVDPYANPMSDGWSNVKKYQGGMNPLTWYTPPPPSILSVSLNTDETHVTITWQSGGGAVSNFTVLQDSSPVIQLGSNIFQQTIATGFNYTNAENLFFLPVSEPEFQVRETFPNGDYVDSDSATASQASYKVQAQIVRGAAGLPYLVVQSPPTNLVHVTLAWLLVDGNDDYEFPHYDIQASNLVRGVMPIPTNVWVAYTNDAAEFSVLFYSSNNLFGYSQPVAATEPEQVTWPPIPWSFVDARSHLKDNLKFLLRSATASDPFSYSSDQDTTGDRVGEARSLDYETHGWFVRATNSQPYECSGFHLFDPVSNFSYLDPYRPANDNAIWKDFLFSTNFSGVSAYTDYGDGYRQLVGVSYPLSICTGLPLPPVASLATATWVYFDPDIGTLPALMPDLGLYTNSAGKLALVSGAVNFYGLSITSAYFLTNISHYATIAAGGSGAPYYGGSLYADVTTPNLQIQGYYFASQTPVFMASEPGYNGPADPLPGSPAFSPTNSGPALIASIGQLYSVSAWAKMGLENGYSDRYGYLEQYFTNANIVTNGIITTNSAGVISPYGEFLPTYPGQVALITMPDIDTGQCGTDIVNVIKLQVDANHDGAMDLSWWGKDNTSAESPLVFWVNQDADWSGFPGDPGEDVEMDSSPIYDCTQAAIPSQRDLEDWARLWICGMPALQGDQYTVVLSMSNVSGNPAVNLVNAAETNGGTLYLTDSNTAAMQVESSPGGDGRKYSTVSSISPLVLPSSLFTNAGDKHFLFEGAGVGQGELVLTVYYGTNAIAQTGAWLDLHEITDFIESARATNVTASPPPSTLTSQCEILSTAQPMPHETKQVVVFVHGINNTIWQSENASETAFKRLYWSGYQGGFATFRWPCAYLPPNNWWPYTYNESEFWAYKSANAFKNYLSYLRSRSDLAGYAIDILAHSQGNAVVSEALSAGGTFDNYILTQGAVPAHCYDGNAPRLFALTNAEASSPTPFAASVGGYNQCWTNISGNMVNFFNTNDFALAKGAYGAIQANWVKNQQTEKPEAFAGGPSYIYYPSTNTSIAYFLLGSSYTVTDWQESRSMVARSRTSAIGAQGLAPGESRQGNISSSVDLFSQFNFSDTRAEHSAQFTRSIQSVWGYYDRVLISFGLNPIAR